MTKQFIYKVDNMEFVESKPFGRAWTTAQHFAKEYHTGIKRTVVNEDGKERHEFLAKGGCFLNEKFYSEEKEKVF